MNNDSRARSNYVTRVYRGWGLNDEQNSEFIRETHAVARLVTRDVINRARPPATIVLKYREPMTPWNKFVRVNPIFSRGGYRHSRLLGNIFWRSRGDFHEVTSLCGIISPVWKKRLVEAWDNRKNSSRTAADCFDQLRDITHDDDDDDVIRTIDGRELTISHLAERWSVHTYNTYTRDMTGCFANAPTIFYIWVLKTRSKDCDLFSKFNFFNAVFPAQDARVCETHTKKSACSVKACGVWKETRKWKETARNIFPRMSASNKKIILYLHTRCMQLGA